ncbi:MAG: hypothetical protein KGL39_00355 [Patescibacteria group bacterium]|nr:hypothetical protein [Patescibacteria group bacterium]
MTTEDLRTEVLAGIDKALGHPMLIGGEGKHVLSAMRVYWTAAGDVELNQLLSCYNNVTRNFASIFPGKE